MSIADYRRRDADAHAHLVSAHLAALEPLFANLSEAGMRALKNSLLHFAAASDETRELLIVKQETSNGPRPQR